MELAMQVESVTNAVDGGTVTLRAQSIDAEGPWKLYGSITISGLKALETVQFVPGEAVMVLITP
jgi:hypothetical protein